MTRKRRFDLWTSLLVGVAILASTVLAKLTADAAWLVMAGPLLLALAVVSADMLDARLRGKPSAPSPGALLLGATFVLAGWMVAVRDPTLVKMLMPVIGAASWVTVLLRSGSRRKVCRWI